MDKGGGGVQGAKKNCQVPIYGPPKKAVHSEAARFFLGAPIPNLAAVIPNLGVVIPNFTYQIPNFIKTLTFMSKITKKYFKNGAHHRFWTFV